MSSKRIAIQMDAPHSLRPYTDTSILLGLGAQKRGYALYHYHPSSLTLTSEGLFAQAQPITLREGLEDWYDVGAWQRLRLNDMRVILMRQDPPFDMTYITATHLLETLMPDVFVTNHPAQVRNCPEKIFPLLFSEYMPATIITHDRLEIISFLEQHNDIVIKPLYGYAGLGIFRLKKGGDNIEAILETLLMNSKEPFMCQRFLPEVIDGDKRILFVDGEVAGVLGRIPAEGEIRANFRVGGSAALASLTPKLQTLCTLIGKELKKRDLLLAGIDVIGEYLTEINLTSPTGIPAIKRLYGNQPEALVWDAIERKISK